MTKQELQSALNVEKAILEAHYIRQQQDKIGPTQAYNLIWHSEQRIEAIHQLASDRGWVVK